MGEIVRKKGGEPAAAPAKAAPAAAAQGSHGGHGGHGSGSDDDFTLPHASKWPIIAAAGLTLLYLAVAGVARLGNNLAWATFGLAALVVAFAAFGIIREDAQWWRDRVSTGARNGWWGVVFFLGTEVMLFGALFATYFNHAAFRETDATWAIQAHLPVVVTGINTVILLLSGATMHYAHHAIRKGDLRGLKIGLAATILLGAVFIAGQVFEYLELAHEGLVVQGITAGTHFAELAHYSGPGTFGAVFYILTGTHGAHVTGGLIVLMFVLWRTMKGNFDQQRHMAVEAAAIYWHFVDVVWVLLYAVVYLRLF